MSQDYLQEHILNFFQEHNISEKKVIFLNYELNYYPTKNFWCFDIAVPAEYKLFFEDLEQNSIGKIFQSKNNIFLETEHIYFVLEKLTSDSIKAFQNLESFYFRLLDATVEDNPLINTVACNPL